MTNLEKKLYSVKEAAALLSVSPTVIRRMIRDNELKATKIRLEWRVTAESLEKYLNPA